MGTKYKLIFFVPLSALEAVKTAVFAASAGRYPGPGNYTECAWQTNGTASSAQEMLLIHTSERLAHWSMLRRSGWRRFAWERKLRRGPLRL